MRKINRNKRSKLSSRKSYYSALAICLAMVGLACFCSYKDASERITEKQPSVTEKHQEPALTAVRDSNEAVDASKNKKGVKKDNLPPEITEYIQSGITEKVHPETEKSSEAPVSAPSRKFCIPVNGEIIQEFSGSELVKNQTTGAWQTHNGTDIAGSTGDEVRAMTDGKVTEIYEDPLWGVVVVIDHGEGLTARYCGLNKGLSVTAEKSVSSGEVIGALGDTADIESAEETHLHLEVLRNGVYTNPVDVINNKG